MLLGVDVVVDFGAVVVVLFGTVVVADLGGVVLVVSFGAVVLVVPLAAGVVVVLVAEGTTVVVELAGDVVDGSLATVPEVPDALEPPNELAVHVVEVTKVVIDVLEVPPKPLAGVPGFPSVDCDVE